MEADGMCFSYITFVIIELSLYKGQLDPRRSNEKGRSSVMLEI